MGRDGGKTSVKLYYFLSNGKLLIGSSLLRQHFPKVPEERQTGRGEKSGRAGRETNFTSPPRKFPSPIRYHTATIGKHEKLNIPARENILRVRPGENHYWHLLEGTCDVTKEVDYGLQSLYCHAQFILYPCSHSGRGGRGYLIILPCQSLNDKASS